MNVKIPIGEPGFEMCMLVTKAKVKCPLCGVMTKGKHACMKATTHDKKETPKV